MEDKLIVSLSADIKDLKAKLSEAQKELGKFSNDVDKGANKQAQAFSGLESSITGLIAGFVSLAAAQRLLTEAFNTSLKLDAVNQSFSAIFGSAEEGQRQFERLKRVSDELGLSVLTLADSYKQFAASSNLSVNETNRIFDSVAKAGAVLKLSEEQVSRALTAMAQMMSKGTVQAEELKGQLGEALPSAFKLAAKAMGVTTAELQKMLENGQVMAADLLPKLATELDKTFGSKVQGNVKGLASEWARFKNNFTLAVEASKIGDAFEFLLERFNTKLKIFTLSARGEMGRLQDNLQFEIDATKTEQDLNKLIGKFTEQQKTLKYGTEAWVVYTNAIVEAGKKAKDFKAPTIQAPTKQGRVVGGEAMQKIDGASEQMAEAKVLFQLYKESPQSLKIMGDAYASNPFFRDLINGELNEKTKEFANTLKEMGNTPNQTFNGEAIGEFTQAQIDNAQNLVNILGSGLTSAFDAAMLRGADFGTVLVEAIKNIIKQLLAAVAVTTILAGILSALGLGGAVIGKGGGSLFGTIFKGLTGFNLGGDAPVSNSTSSIVPSDSSMNGKVSFQIRGDELYGVLENYNLRRARLV